MLPPSEDLLSPEWHQYAQTLVAVAEQGMQLATRTIGTNHRRPSRASELGEARCQEDGHLPCL